MSPSRSNQRRWILLLCLGMACVLWFLLQRSLGLYPGIFVDEWYYSKMARLTPLAEAIVPSYLYLWLFGAASACGDGFLDCARIGNAVLFVAAAPFLYLTARRLVAPGPACALALASLLLPMNLYTVFFMPEAMYFLGFALLAWTTLTSSAQPPALRALAAGCVLGLMSLVKIHALFLLPALCLFLLCDARGADGRLRIAQGLLAALAAPAAFFAVKFGLGWLIAGSAGVSLFGSFYDSGASSAAQHTVWQLLGPLWVSLRGHLMAAAFLFALPLAVLLHVLFDRAGRQRDPALARLWLFTFLVFGSALGVAALFTSTIASVAPDEGIRLHSRYYSFALPLVLLCALAAGLRAPRRQAEGSRARGAVALALGLVLVAAALLLRDYRIVVTDTPEYLMLHQVCEIEYFLLFLNAALLARWVFRPRQALLLFACLAVPLVVLRAGDLTGDYLHNLRQPAAADNAGRAARALIPAADLGAVTIAATNSDLFRVQFQMDAPDATLLNLPQGAPVESYQLARTSRWLVVSGARALPAGLQPLRSGPDWQVVALPRTERRSLGSYVFGAPAAAGLVARSEGLSTPEPWGRWSDAKVVRLHLDRALPARATVILKANAFGPNIDQPFVLRAGAASTTFRLGNDASEVVLRLDTDGAQRVLEIEVPHPQRPSDNGRSGDSRLLGIALLSLAIEVPAGD